MAYTQLELDYEQHFLLRLYFLFTWIWVGMIAAAVIAVGG